MISSAVYITSEEARIFNFLPEGVQTEVLKAHGPHHQSETQGKNHPIKGSDADKFFHEVAEFLFQNKNRRYVLVGPGLAKNHLKTHIDEHHKNCAKQIMSVESLDKSTDGEIKNFAHDYFKKAGLFESINMN